ncbi:hypothetical protein ACFOEW_03615 [Alteromonas oceani]|uniref:Uncharacterized protein n=1 Tax=Alteromonas oceani TaxID=2071609 RepID=A0ABV7K086_9ALTE|nr:hypothetical protein [Alteromonas oceani]|tara:strand:+ start:2105 stop:2824 length:720 start_codon:yes stop_codon:yes gene_type:complete
MKNPNFRVFFALLLVLFSATAFSKVQFYSYPDYVQPFVRGGQFFEINIYTGNYYPSNFAGNKFELDIRDYDTNCPSGGCVNDNIDSVSVDSGECVILGRDSYFFNDWVVLDQQDNPDLGWFKNRATSYAVFPGPCDLDNRIIFYRNTNGESDKFPAFIAYGAADPLSPFVPNGLPEVGKFNDRFSSVYLPAGAAVTLYQHSNYQGLSLTLSNTTSIGKMYNLTDYGFNDRTSSYEILSI